MIGFLFALALCAAVVLGCFLGWHARSYLDRRSRYYFRRGQSLNSASSALSLDPEPLIDVDSIIDPVIRSGVRNLVSQHNKRLEKNHV